MLDTVHYSAAWYDGRSPGFDRRGEDLPRSARILAIVDAFDAMTTDHVYRRAMSRERAMTEMFEHAGTQFDPKLVGQIQRFSGEQSGTAAGLRRQPLVARTPEPG